MTNTDIMGKRHKWDVEYVEKLCKSQPDEDFNATDVAKRYCKKKGLDYSVARARRVQHIISKNGFHIDSVNPKTSVQYKEATKKVFKSKRRNTIIMWAQAKTPIHKELWENIQAYAKLHKAEIVVMAGTYLNPNSSYSKQVKREFAWDDTLTPYLYASRAEVHKHLRLVCDTDILPTAKKPLNGLHSITGIESCVIGHPRQHMQIIPTMKNSPRKFMFTTGSITVPNYRKSRQGTESIEHHKMGFLIVENLNDAHFVARHVESETDGSFQDLHYRVENGTVTKGFSWDAMVFGDTHLSKEDPVMLTESRRLINKVGCSQTIWHDLMDGYSINHHQMKDHVAQVIKASKGLNILQSELDMNIEFIKNWKDTNMVIIPSNHPDWLDKWVRLNHNAKHAVNSVLFNKFQSVLYQELAPKGLYAYVIEQEFGDSVLCLHRDNSHQVQGIELNNHGDLGSNGAKGTPITFAKLNTKIVSGDKHHCYTIDNAYGVGISGVLDHGYNKGMSSWAQSNGIILSNGKFQHLLYFDGKFTNLI